MPELPQERGGRKDPKPRHVIGSKEAKVLGKRPDRHYVLAHRGAGGEEDYREAGYEVERYASKIEDGCRVAGEKRAKAGDAITFRGHVLMSIDIEDAKARAAEAQAEADEIEKQIIRQRRGVDGLRGLNVVRTGHLSLESAGADFTA